MYLRPRQVFERYFVEEKISTTDDTGRLQISFKPAGELWGAISTLRPAEAQKWRQLHHEVDTVIVSKSPIKKAQTGWRLVRGGEIFLIEHAENVLERWQIYYCKQRGDMK